MEVTSYINKITPKPLQQGRNSSHILRYSLPFTSVVPLYPIGKPFTSANLQPSFHSVRQTITLKISVMKFRIMKIT